jgi:hypothetical protein
MHGGFENETPNIPTNSIMKLDMVAHVKSNPYLLEKLEKASQSNFKPGSSRSDSNSPGGSNSRAATPPMTSLSKANMKIRMGKGEI